jgi:hypothetical protein
MGKYHPPNARTVDRQTTAPAVKKYFTHLEEMAKDNYIISSIASYIQYYLWNAQNSGTLENSKCQVGESTSSQQHVIGIKEDGKLIEGICDNTEIRRRIKVDASNSSGSHMSSDDESKKVSDR